MTEPLSDRVLIERSLAEPECFAALFDRHSAEIFRYLARRLGPDVAEDATAETFLTAFRKRDRFSADRNDARPWLYGIATRTIGEHRRAEVRRRRAFGRLDTRTWTEAFEDRAAGRVTAQQLGRQLGGMLKRLSAGERDLLLLIAWADLTYEEAAEALGVPVGTVRSRLHRARQKARKVLGDTDPLTITEETPA
ncbi:RNA polymerase sigma factor [Actinoallomurus sp. NPDC052308]|uniref:RNA polymerase sigma factor n=1 Tax=Actinoallomurus sp. NPDC052308 TaxID=3155530 RepID=UPI003440B4F9